MNFLETPDTLPPLRDYQQHCYDRRKAEQNNQVICIPTGGGKGNIICRQVIDNVRSIKPTLVIVPTEELLVNLEKRIIKHAPKFYPMMNFVSGSRKEKQYDVPYLFATYQSLYKNLHKCLDYHEVIYDEVHTSSATTPLKCLKHFSKAVHTGYTATPGRLDNKPLDYVYQEINMCPLSVREMVDRGYLADFDIYGVPIDGFLDAYANRERGIDQDGLGFQQSYLSNNRISEQIYDNWASTAYNTKTIGFASGVEHAELLTEMFNSKFSTKRFAFMHNKMKYAERKAMLEAFHENRLLGIFNVNMLCMGVDVPDARTALLCRKTQSDNMHRQQMGRVLRVKPDGSKAIFIDCVGNCSTHGSPTFLKDYSLQSNPDEKVDNPTVICPCCVLPVANRSKLVAMIKNYQLTGNMPKLFTEISTPKVTTKNDGSEFLVFHTVIKCDNCENQFSRKFEVFLSEGKIDRGVRFDDSLGTLQRLDHESIDEHLLHKQLQKILAGFGTTQNKRGRILRGKYPDDQKYQALILLGESPDSAKTFLGME